MNKEDIKQKITEMTELNSLMKHAAKMVGYDVEGETEKLDKRIRVNIYQKARIQFLEELLKEE